jgi:hypothetical protein
MPGKDNDRGNEEDRGKDEDRDKERQKTKIGSFLSLSGDCHCQVIVIVLCQLCFKINEHRREQKVKGE